MAKRSSIDASDTTYHSFNDIELLQPPAAPPDTSSRNGDDDNDDFNFNPSKMHRQDSGYESCGGASSPKASTSSHTYTYTYNHSRRPLVARHNSTTCTTRTRASRPSTRRSNFSYSNTHQYSYHPHHPLYKESLYQVKGFATSQPGEAYYHFPALDHDSPIEPETSSAQMQLRRLYDDRRGNSSISQHPPTPSQRLTPLPPQTTHYWTSDSTRRLEYAAIDAAGRGVKGWIKKHLVPECFSPRESQRHIAFDDDSGSVRRYRLELKDEPDNSVSVGVSQCAQLDYDEDEAQRRKGWRFWKENQ